MSLPFPSLLHHRHHHFCGKPFSPNFHKTLTFSRKPPNSSEEGFHEQVEYEEEEQVLGDCLVFEDGAFEDPYIQTPNPERENKITTEAENLIPDKWKEVQLEINITKKERRKLKQEMEFGSRLERRKIGYRPIVVVDNVEEWRKSKLNELRPLVLDNPNEFREDVKDERVVVSSQRVAPRNPKMEVYGRGLGLDHISRFFTEGSYHPHHSNNLGGSRKLFTKEEKVLLNRRVPDLAAATSLKWLPLHTLAASGEFYLATALLKYNVDINAPDKHGLTAIHKAILGKKQAIFNFLLRESANPFVRDDDGATLMHYAVRTASSQMIKILLLYNVDINLPDNDGWTPLHLAVQSRRTDVVRLLLIKGADKTLKNKDGLTPLELCLHSGRDTRTYELIRLLKQLPKRR